MKKKWENLHDADKIVIFAVIFVILSILFVTCSSLVFLP